MKNLQIVTDESVLRKECTPIDKNDNIKDLLESANGMLKLMLEKEGVGIAAPQVGINKRFFIAFVEIEEGKLYPQLFINPVITNKSEKMNEGSEGCLSIPDCSGMVSRHEYITVKYYDIATDKTIQKEFTGFSATVIQHEYDHLEGILYTDKAENIISTKLLNGHERHNALKELVAN
jgi:peptide deformylase